MDATLDTSFEWEEGRGAIARMEDHGEAEDALLDLSEFGSRTELRNGELRVELDGTIDGATLSEGLDRLVEAGATLREALGAESTETGFPDTEW